MGRKISLGNPPVDVSLRRSARARRLSLRVSRLTGAVTLTMPQSAPEREALTFLRERENWVRGHLSDLRPAAIPAIGGSVPFKGQPTPLVAAAIRAPRFADHRLEIPEGAEIGPTLRGFLKASARAALVEASDRYARLLDRRYARITLRDTTSRWGSCSARGGLNYSWRLIMAPPTVLDYVAAHEVAHLVEMNHSKAFWDTVESVCPGYRAPRQWLRDEGATLHAISFDH